MTPINGDPITLTIIHNSSICDASKMKTALLLAFDWISVRCHRTVITHGLQIGPMRKRALHFLNIIPSSYRIFSLYAYTFFFPYYPPSSSCSNDSYCIIFEWTTFYAYDTTLSCSLFHSPLSQRRRIPYTLFFILEQAFELSLIHSS